MVHVNRGFSRSATACRNHLISPGKFHRIIMPLLIGSKASVGPNRLEGLHGAVRPLANVCMSPRKSPKDSVLCAEALERLTTHSPWSHPHMPRSLPSFERPHALHSVCDTPVHQQTSRMSQRGRRGPGCVNTPLLQCLGLSVTKTLEGPDPSRSISLCSRKLQLRYHVGSLKPVILKRTHCRYHHCCQRSV